LQVRKNFSKFEDTFFANEPACGQKSAAGVAFAIFCRMTQGDGIRGRVETDFVGADVSSGAISAERDWPGESRSAHFDFELLSDFWPHGAVATQYGVFDPERGIANRGTFIIDKDGIVRWKVVNPVLQARDLAEYSKALAALG